MDGETFKMASTIIGIIAATAVNYGVIRQKVSGLKDANLDHGKRIKELEDSRSVIGERLARIEAGIEMLLKRRD